MRPPILFRFLTVVLFVCSIHPSHAQYRRKSRKVRSDSALIEINTHVSDSLLQENEIRDTTIPFLVNKAESYSFILNRAYSFSNRNLDTAGIVTSIGRMDQGLNSFRKSLEKNDIQLNLRNLNTIAILMGEAMEKLADWNETLTGYSDQTKKSNEQVKKVLHDSTLVNAYVDSLLRGQLSAVRTKAQLMDSIQTYSLVRIKTLRNRVSINTLLCQDLLTEISTRTKALKAAMWGVEEPPFLQACIPDYDRSFGDLAVEAVQRSIRILVFYFNATWDTRSLNLAIWFALLIWFFINMRRVRRRETNPEVLDNVRFLKRSSVLSSLLLLLTFGPFVYLNAPAAYLHINELARVAILTFLIWPYLVRRARILWILLALNFCYFLLDDLLLDSAYAERWTLLIGALATLIIAVLLFRQKSSLFQKGLEESRLRKLIHVVAGTLATASLIANMAGRVTVAKVTGIASVEAIVFGLTLKVFCHILLDAVYIQSESFQNSRFSSFLNFIELKNKLRSVLTIAASGLWLMAILGNLMLFDPVRFYLDFFFTSSRSIGNVKFSFYSVLLFVLVIYISSVLSQFVNFFFETGKTDRSTRKRSRLGSINLIIRIAIWTGGFMIAVAAAGIPINKISILLGALGVGIGFGLQNLVNNLVSGIILAFEHPIQIGDLIEVAGKTGTVKEIGVRSSKLSNGEGANIIIPNGDLLSQQLINWTQDDRTRRIRVLIAVPYRSDVVKAREMIEQTLAADKDIMKDPAPVFTIESLANNTVNFELLCWAADLGQSAEIRNNIMLDLYKRFHDGGIDLTVEHK